MCYSALVEADLRKTAYEFGAHIDIEEFRNLFLMREKKPEIKIPVGLEAYFLSHQEGSTEKAIVQSILAFREQSTAQREQELNDLDAEILEIETRLKTKVTKTNKAKLEVKLRKREKLLRDPYQTEPGPYRIYPYYFAPVLVADDTTRKLVPMRYRVLPSDGIEIPSKYNLFNARRDSLFQARTWKSTFGKTHAIFPFIQFYEWVESKDHRKQEIVFKPQEMSKMWAASLYSETPTQTNGLIHRSFAMITDEPPPEVAAAGHDRCPVFLKEDLIDRWLHPVNQRLEELESLLSEKVRTFYSHSRAA